MAQSTWSADSYVWSGTPHVWSNDTYQETATIATNSVLTSSGTAIYPVTVTLTQVILSELNEEDTVFPRSLAFGTNVGMTGTGYIAAPVTATFATNGTFSNTGLATMPQSVTLSANATMTDAGVVIYPASITLASTENISNSGLTVMPESVTFANTVRISYPVSTTWNLETNTWATVTTKWGYAQSLIMPVTATLANEQGVIINVNFEESATLAILSSTASANSFLWNDRVEDDSSVWTAIASGDDPLWSNEAEDTGTTWTKISDPDD
jgi:hypothetical protein|tara:strand:- start:333 stop:1136 length:804 start_codon:yes stop_codon:yes gene_type:complete